MSSREGSSGTAKPFAVSLSKQSNENNKAASSLRGSSSNGFGKSKKIVPRRHPHRHLYHDFSADDDDDDESHPVAQEVVGFDSSAGGAISKDASAKDKAPLVIKVESKNNWRDRPGVNRRGRNLLPQEVQAAQAAAASGSSTVVETEGPNVSYGLSLAPSRGAGEAESHETGAVAREDVDMPDAAASSTTTAQPNPAEPVGQDELALQALIRESQGNNDQRRTDLVIEASSKGETRYDETSSFRTDVATRPDPASLEAYNAIPVEEFGAALLRGMGWKEGQAIGRGRYDGSSPAPTKATVPERRPGFLGIGAKDISGGKGAEVEIGAWGKAAMRKGSRKNGDSSGNTAGVYMPIVMKNKATGEHLTEEEFKLRQLELKESSRREGRERRHKVYADDDDDHSESTTQDRRRGRSKDSSSRRHRDRSRSSGAHGRRSRRYDDEKESEKDRRRYRDRSDREYKDRSSHKDDYRSSRRDRDSTRRDDRDRDRDRDRRHRSERDHRDEDSGRDRDRYKDSSRRR